MRMLLLVILMSALPAYAAEPTEAGLLSAWEARQQADPKVTLIEKIGEKEYRYETTYFPYSGKLIVTDVVIDDSGSAYSHAMGFVQVKLPDMDESQLTDFAYAFSIWQRTNTLYWDKAASEWITWNESQARWQDTERPGRPGFDNEFQLLLILVLLIVVLWVMRKAKFNMKQSLDSQQQALAGQQQALAMMKRSLELQEETNRLLKRIADDAGP